MLQQLKSCFVIASVLLVIVPVSGNSVESTDSSVLITSQSTDGIWVNESLEISGSTSLNPQTADWVLYDVTNPYIEWPILRSGEFFTSVTPVEEGLWDWSLTIDVQGVNCTCWLEIAQPNGLDMEFLNRIFFIGVGSHNPVISPLHESTIFLDGPVEIYARVILSDSNVSEGNLILDWCSSPNGACDGETFSEIIGVSWEQNIASFTLNASEMDLNDGVWSFSYSFQDVYLKESQSVEMTVYVDRNAPLSSMISPSESLEGENILIDGSGSSDGVWTNNLQYIWYITKPDGTVYVPPTSGTGSILDIALNESGIHTIRLDVIDWVGRMNSTSNQIYVKNSDPLLGMRIEGFDVADPNSWQFDRGDNISLQPTVTDSGDSIETLTFSWYLDSKLVSSSKDYSIKDLKEGTHSLLLIVTDDDGANGSYEIEIVILSDSETENDNLSTGSVIVLIGIIGFSLMMFKRINNRDSDSKTLPKWNDNSMNTNDGTTESDGSDNAFWD